MSRSTKGENDMAQKGTLSFFRIAILAVCTPIYRLNIACAAFSSRFYMSMPASSLQECWENSQPPVTSDFLFLVGQGSSGRLKRQRVSQEGDQFEGTFETYEEVAFISTGGPLQPPAAQAAAPR